MNTNPEVPDQIFSTPLTWYPPQQPAELNTRFVAVDRLFSGPALTPEEIREAKIRHEENPSQRYTREKTDEARALAKTIGKSDIKRKMNILIVGTGGTFQSSETEMGLEPTGSLSATLNGLAIPDQTRARFNLHSLELFKLDSAKMNVTHWRSTAELIAYFLKECREKIHGIIVTHGTDTMNLGGSYLSFMLGRGLPIPIIFTGSQIPAGQEGSDANTNFANSLHSIRAAAESSLKYAEVGVLCGPELIRATRAIKASDHDPRTYVATSDDGVLMRFGGESDITRIKFAPHTLTANPGFPFHPFTRLEGTAANLQQIAMEGIDPEILRKTLQITPASIVTLLGSGTAADVIAETLVEFYRAGKLIILRSPFADSRTTIGTYAAGRSLRDAQLPYVNGTTPAITAKYLHRISFDGMKPKKGAKNMGSVFSQHDQTRLAQAICLNHIGEWQER